MDKKTAEQVQRLIDKDQITDVIHRYCRAADRCDQEAFKACYWPDARDDHGFFGGNAHELGDYVIPILRTAHSSIHAITNIIIDLDGDRASVESQWSVIHRLQDEDEFLDWWHQGRYFDTFERRDSEWRILFRKTINDMDRLLRTRDIVKAFGDANTSRAPGSPNAQTRGARFPNDPIYADGGPVSFVKDRPPIADLWAPFYALKNKMAAGNN